MLVNLETMETETYPEDYWTTVAERVHATLTDDQKAALKTCWTRVKANKAALTAQHNQLSTRLEQLQQLQQQHQQKFEEQAAQLPLLQPDGSFSGVLAATAAAGARDSINNSMTKASSRVEEVLLPVASKEQRKIERQLLSIAEKIKLQHFCQILQFHNTLSNKQMAELYVSSWPFLPDSLAVCEALDELGW
ncbi:hypothetical protein OEZ86_003298 [Tetradesmus obliquus]|nr:hypothetical protein OEZ86_003298 [Tetradesmus obliquus]